MSTSKFITLASSGAALLASVAAANAQFVAYDNTKFSLDTSYTTGDEYGDEIALKLGPRTASEFSFDYYSDYDLSKGATLRFYKNDGALASGQASPGTLLYESTAIDLQKGYHTVKVDFTSVPFQVPDRFTWTVKFDGVDPAAGKRAALLVYNPPGPGASSSDFWVRNGSVWSVSQLASANGVTPANFNAKLITVPEPSTFALVGVGALGWLGFASARRNKK